MRIIVDTHIFLWLLNCPGKINKKNLSILQSPVNMVYLSSISVAEIMIKSSIGKLEVAFDPADMAKKSGLELLDFSVSDASLLQELPLHHKDPFDRMLICQSINRECSILTSDRKFRPYDCALLT